MRKPCFRPILVTLLVLLAAPSAAASHWMLYYEAGDPYVGQTREDDEAIVNAAGSPFHGRQNRVVASGGIPGDDSTFLDAIVGQHVGLGRDAGLTDVYAGSLTGAAAMQDVLLPGAKRISAWYGDWSDHDGNDAILDLHDAACGDAACPEDEFRWRGVATGETSTAIAAYLIPKIPRSTLVLAQGNTLRPPYLAAWGDSSGFDRIDLQDRTGLANPEQGWYGSEFTGAEPNPVSALFINLDTGLLATVHTVVVAGAPFATGSIGFDLDAPSALVDVDVYQSVSGDVEALYLAAASTFRANDPWRSIEPIPGPVFDALVAAIMTTRRDAEQLVAASAGDPRTFALTLVSPADAKEPNTEEDDFQGRATFGGVGDHAGTSNRYDAYQTEYHLYVDHVARTSVCAGVAPEIQGAPTSPSAAVMCQWIPSEQVSATVHGSPGIADPYGAHVAEGRTPGTLLTFETYVVLWRDRNGDQHLGDVCNPSDGAAFDTSTNACRKPPHPWPHRDGGTTEHIRVCHVSDAKGGSFTLTPVGGPWPNVVVFRNVRGVTLQAEDVEVVSGTQPITLNWDSTCETGSRLRPSLYSADAILLPPGSGIGIRVDADVGIDGYFDTNANIDVGPERVRDVDYLAAGL